MLIGEGHEEKVFMLLAALFLRKVQYCLRLRRQVPYGHFRDHHGTKLPMMPYCQGTQPTIYTLSGSNSAAT